MSKEVEEFVDLYKELTLGLNELGHLDVPAEQITSMTQSIYKYRHEQPRGGFAKGGFSKPARKEVKEVKGEVQAVYDNETYVAIKIDGQRYSAWDKKLVEDIEEGNNVVLAVEKNAKGFWNIVSADVAPY